MEKHVVSATIRALKEEIAAGLVSGNEYDLGRDFGKFTSIIVASRTVLVPSTGKEVTFPPRRKIRFRPASQLTRSF